MYKAPAVVIGTDVYHSDPVDDDGNISPEDNYAILSVECIMKSGGYNINENITIWEGAVRDSAACQRTQLEVGTKYVIGLELDPSVSKDRFEIYEPNVMTKGAFEATQETLDVAAQICGLQEVQAVGGAEDTCPTKTAEDCTTGTGPILLSAMVTYWCTLVCILCVNTGAL